MEIRVRRRLLVPLAAVALITSGVVGTGAATGPRDVTATARGRSLVEVVAARHAALGVRGPAEGLRAWEVTPGEYLVARRLPAKFSTRSVTDTAGRRRVELRYDVATPPVASMRRRATAGAKAGPSWVWQDQECFTRLGDTNWGFLDSCYLIHRLRNESHPRDFYKLEQYGTVGAGLFRKIYDGWLAATKGPGSSAMAWVDWSPRGDLAGSCQGVPLGVSALGVGITASGVMCERWDMTKSSAAGSYRQQWGCGCILPFGQPWPNNREIDYMQAVSVQNGGAARWTLSAGFTSA